MKKIYQIFLCLIVASYVCDSVAMESSEYLELYNIADNISFDTAKTDITSKYLDVYQQANSLYLNEKLKAYEEARAKEQSLANRTLTALTVAATGIGGMELAMGLSQQKADKDAAADMEAYIESFHCSYGGGKTVKAGPEEIELPGGNDQTMMNYRAEYMALAQDLTERKNALGMKPGIESEVVLDKAQMGLYDDENIGIISGNYESLYRAKMLDSEEDQSKIDANAQSAKNRVIGGGVAAGVGVVGGVVGDALINKKSSKRKK